MIRIAHFHNITFLLLIFGLTYFIAPPSSFCQVKLDNPILFYERGQKLETLFPDSAIYYYQKGLDLLEFDSVDYDRSFLRIKLLTSIGQIFHMESKYSFASDYYSRGLNEAIMIKNDSLIAECHFNIAEIGLENGGFPEAIENYNSAHELFERLNHLEGLFWSNIGLGIVFRELGNTKYSEMHYTKAREIGELNDKKDFVAISFNNMGNLYKQIGEYDKSLNYLQQALKNFEESGEEKFISDCLEGIGEVYAEMGDSPKALNYFNRSTEIAEILGDSYRLLSRYANKANTYADLGDNENALMYFSKTIELAQSVGDKARLSEVLIMVSDYYRMQNDFVKSLEKLNQALRISSEIGDTVSMASAYNSLSELYFLKDEQSSAYDHALKAYQIASKKDLMKTLSESASKLSTILEIRGNHKDALYYFKTFERTKDFLFNSEKMKILKDTEAKYNVEKIEREQLELQNFALQREEKIQKRNNFILLLIIILGFFAISSVGYLLRKRNEKRAMTEKSSKMKDEITFLSNQLSERNRELTTKALLISQNNDLLKNVVSSIEEYLRSEEKDQNVLRKLKSQLQQIYEEKSWDDFIHHFEQVHPMFYKNLIKKCDDLSSMEQKICAFLKMKLNTKDISQITGQSIKAIEVMRSRIRKKMEIPHEDSLTKAIQKI